MYVRKITFYLPSSDDADHDRFNLLISIMATAQVILLAMARPCRGMAESCASGLVGSDWLGNRPRALSCVSFSFLLYRILPEIRFVQLPLRWLLCLNVAFVLLVTLAFRPWLLRVLACVVMLAVLVWVWHRVQPPWWDTAADVAEMLDNQESNLGYEGTDEYVPTGADAYEINKDAQQVALEGDGSSRIHIIRWAPEHRSFTASANRPGRLVLKLFNYPAWRVEVNGHAVRAGTVEVTGQMIVPVAAGENRVTAHFTRTPDRIDRRADIARYHDSCYSGWMFFGKRVIQAHNCGSRPRLNADTNAMRRILIATSNAGKLRDFAGAASSL